MALKIPQTLFNQLRQHGEETYPHECCGVLVGEIDETGSRTVRRVVQCGNAQTASPQSRYQISPSELIRVQHEARLAGHDIVGFYHSHPDCPARWSSTDLAEAYWTGCSYVITRIEHGKAADTNSYLLLGAEDSKHFENEAIEV